MNLSFENVQKALTLGKEFLARVGAFELAEILGISKAQMFALIEANRDVFAVNPEDKSINLTENKDNIFATVEESKEFFIRKTCGGNPDLGTNVMTRKAIASYTTNPIHWIGDFEYAFYVRMDHDKIGTNAKTVISNEQGKEIGDRVTCLGRVVAGGTTPDKWLFGVVPTKEECDTRMIGGKHMYYHRWVQDDANKVNWVIPQSLMPLALSIGENKQEVTKQKPPKKLAEKAEKADPKPQDVPGQQMLPGTDPKPVETAPPASIIKAETAPVAETKPVQMPPVLSQTTPAVSTAPVNERPPVAGAMTTTAGLKADIKAKAIEEHAAVNPPMAQNPVSTPATSQVTTPIPSVPKEEIMIPPATAVSASVKGPDNSTQALGLLDNLLKMANQNS